MNKLILSKRDITREIIAYLKSKNIPYWGKSPEIRIKCVFGSKDHDCTIFTDNGLVVCEICKRMWSFETFQLELTGRVSIFLEESKNSESKLGILNSIPKGYTQLELEENISQSHECLKRNPELLHWFTSTTGIIEKTIDAFRIGWTGDFIAAIPFKNYTCHFVLPVVSPSGAYYGLRFFSKVMLSNNQMLIIPGWGGNIAFWGNKPKRIYAFWITDNPILCMKISQKLAFAGPEDICVLSSSAGVRNMPVEWTHREFFGRKIILLTSSEKRFTNMFRNLMKKLGKRQKYISQLSKQNVELLRVANAVNDLPVETIVFTSGK